MWCPQRLLDTLSKDPAARRPTSTVGKEIHKLESELWELPNDFDIDARFTFTSDEIKYVGVMKSLVFGYCVNSVRDKNWRCHKCGMRAT